MRALVLLLLGLCAAAQAAPVTLTDDAGNSLTLPASAQRIVSLAPHVTELLFAAGAGEKIVGTVEYSDYPAQAKAIPRVGDNQRLDLERILALHPDLIVVWLHGNAQRQLDQLRRLGIPMFYSEPKKLADIGPAIEVLGRLAGTEITATQAARQYDIRLARLTRENSVKAPLKVFFQIWDQPVMTINNGHLMSDAIQTCGGRNVFGALPALVPTIDIEAVLAADPQVIVASGADATRPPWLDDWKRWQRLDAVRQNNLYFIPPELITRLAPRVLDGVEMLCKELDEARSHKLN
ncbi:MAG: cobalamin-binding protein [Betaproteobacteria bacterium]|nr:cobalamin-binding protein [Betaproteobacteria bacterium]